jgi:hypothetical protein
MPKYSQQVLKTLQTLKTPGQVTEVRILNTTKRTIAGYFDDHDQLIKAIEPYVGTYDIYLTLNPVKQEMLSRYHNRLEPFAKSTSADKDIERIAYVLIDIDPIRSSGISASKTEKAAALYVLKVIRKELRSQGFPAPLVADSGNGYHLLLPVDFDNTKENVDVMKEFLMALDFLYSNDQAQVDVSTFNPSRIVKLYGTKACKGDETTERPHRWSKIIEVPEDIIPASLAQLKQVIAKQPKISSVSTNNNQRNRIDVEAFIKKYDLDLAFQADYGTNATKYIFNTCPWNSDHTNQSAYIIQFHNGGIAAGCHHNSCQSEDWKSLREMFNDESVPSIGGEEKQSDVLIKLAENFQYFTNDIEEPYAAIPKDGHWEVMAVKSKKFKLNLMRLYYDQVHSTCGDEAFNQAIRVLEMKAVFSDNERPLQRRITDENGHYYYDLCNSDWQVIKINEEGCKIESNPPILFTRTKNMREQVKPDFSMSPSVLIDLVKKHFRFKKELDAILFTVYLVSCFIPDIAHVILVLFGEKGAAKSTTMRMIKRLVDPAKQDLLTMPTSKADLAIVLSNNYMPCFDNLDSLSAEKSDMLCMAATGGAFTKRTLYTDSDETILRFKRCLALNGINVVATRADLLDRSLTLELGRIPKQERLTERKIWCQFEEDIPKMLGAIFNTISEAIPKYDETVLDEVGRMADFTYWGYAIAEVLGLGGEVFQAAYLQNQDTANEEALSSHPVAAAVIALLKHRISWSGSVSALLRELELTADRERINKRVKTWAKDANVLSKRLKEVKSNLEEVGIFYDIRHAGNYKKITLEKHGDTGRLVSSLERPVETDIDDEMDTLFED